MFYKKPIVLLLAFSSIFFSCKKENLDPTRNDQQANKSDEKSHNYQKSVIPNVWALGYDNRVYHWNGASWDEPNSAARMVKISASPSSNGVVWAVGNYQKVYRWNGASWDLPNSGMALVEIAAVSHNEAWGVGNYNNIYRTVDGVTWNLIPKTGLPVVNGVQGLDKISSGRLGIATDGLIYSFNTKTQSWSLVSGQNSQDKKNCISGTSAGYWAIASYSTWSNPEVYNNIVNSFGINTLTVSMIFVSSNFYTINEPQDVWALGWDNRVYSWNGASWDEPNPAARMYFLSVGK